MGELQQAVGRLGPLAVLAGTVLLATGAAGCGPVAPSGSGALPSVVAPPSAPDASASPTGSTGVSPGPPAVQPSDGRLVWSTDRTGGLGIWTTDLAGRDVRPYITGLDDAGVALRDARLVGDDVMVIREAPAASTAELWAISIGGLPRVLLDAVVTFVAHGDDAVLAVRDQGRTRTIWLVPTSGAPARAIAEVPLPIESPELGPFGFAISPDGRTVAAGWVGGPTHIVGPAPATLHDVGAPLVVGDDGRLVAVTGRAGEAYLVDADRLVDLAPPDSDPVALPGTGSVAWPSVGEGDGLRAVEVRDLLMGTSQAYPASGPTTNVVELTATHVVLEATAFDPVRRTVGVLDRRDGGFGTFEASAPVD